eukprot:TRINITY_DN20667_c0_g1_i1.p1 TRINITY_DN20667_c0_g1~~TRINITY_DN20667_c0_g1_i1.p1  ORF type:complete len:783 (+),score=110.43 TRINITY_DN20667_c0_g1_i1:67-2415(+)
MQEQPKRGMGRIAQLLLAVFVTSCIGVVTWKPRGHAQDRSSQHRKLAATYKTVAENHAKRAAEDSAMLGATPVAAAPASTPGPTTDQLGTVGPFRVLLTGATGMIGSHVGRELLRRGYKVYALIRFRSALFNMRDELSQYELLYGDVVDQVRMRQVIAAVRPHFVYHLAAQAIESEGNNNPELTLRVNVLGTLSVLEGIRASQLSPMPRVLYAASSAVYGRVGSSQSSPETTSLVPVTAIGVSKLAGEALSRMYQLVHKIPTVIARFFPQVGAGGVPFTTLQRTAQRIAIAELAGQEHSMRVHGAEDVLDLSDVKQTARIAIQLAEEGQPGESYNVGSGVATSVEELLRHLASLAKVKTEMKFAPKKIVSAPIADVSKLRLVVGNVSTADLRGAVAEMLKFWRAKIKADSATSGKDAAGPSPPRPPRHPWPPIEIAPHPIRTTAAPASASAPVHVLLTGASGMIGSHVGRVLLDRGYRVFALVRWRSSLLSMAPELEKYDLVYGDILDRTRLKDVVAAVRPKFVFHLAAQSINGEGDKNPDLTLQVNVIGTLNVLEAVRSAGLPAPRVLFAGSSTVYGLAAAQYPQGVPEDGISLAPISVYGVSKFTGEALMRMYWHAHRVPTITSRFFIQIGAGHNHFISIQEFSRQIAMIELGLLPPVLKHGNLKTFRDMSDVRQSAALCVQIAKKGEPGEAYNFGTGAVISIESLLETVVSLAKRPVTRQVDKSRLRVVDEAVLRANVTKLKAAIGAAPTTDMLDTARTILDYWRKKVYLDYGTAQSRA